jgi:hypothetical protein
VIIKVTSNFSGSEAGNCRNCMPFALLAKKEYVKEVKIVPPNIKERMNIPLYGSMTNFPLNPIAVTKPCNRNCMPKNIRMKSMYLRPFSFMCLRNRMPNLEKLNVLLNMVEEIKQ